SLGISGIAVDHTSPNTVYVLTGDGDGANTFSIGIMKSTDGGATWNATGLTWGVSSFVRGYKLLMHPTNSNTMFAVTNVGILKTIDGWNTWSTVQGGSFRDIEFKPGSPATMYATTSNSFYRSTNTGTSWTLVTSGLPTGEDRSEIAVSPANVNYVYYLSGPAGSSNYKGLYRSTNSGASFSTMSTTPNILGYSTAGTDNASQSWYDLAIAVNPGDANNVITGGINVWRSTNGGATMSCITNWFEPPGAFQYVHADIHELVYNPLNNNLYCGSDGGISVSSNDGQSWSNIWSGLQIMQFYKIAGVEANQNLIVGGTQDNGSNLYTGSTTIQHILGGDGMDCMIDYNNNNTMYYSFQNGGLQRSTNGGSTNTGIQPAGSTGAWVTPYAMDASNPNIIYGGYDDVYRSTNQGTNWTNLGSDGRGAFAVGINNPARLYAANNNVLQTSSNTGGSWSTISGPWSTLTVTDIAVDPANANRVWVTVSGYTAGQKVYESTNAGGSWTNISGTLPNVPALCIAYENTGGSPMDAIYVGTDIGVFYTDDSTAWTGFNTGLPNVPIYDLEINHTNAKIRAGTFGRGLWESPLFSAPACVIQIISVTTNPPSCPTSNDGTLTINASCSTCTTIDYTITPTAPPGAPITQTGNGVFTNLAPNSYNVSIEDSNNSACNSTWGSNPVVLPMGTDSIAPAIGCPTNATVECGGDTSPSGTGFATASDNCDPNPSVTWSDSSVANCGNTEVITRSWTATDASGNASTCVQTITVVDTTPPTFTCSSNITVNTDTGSCDAVVNYTAPTGSDGCGGVTINQTGGLSSGSTFPLGTTTNSFDFIDDCGNTVSCSFDIIVEDNEAPVVSCPADQTVDIPQGNTTYSLPDYFGNGTASATDNCTSPVTILSQSPSAGTLLSEGVYTITMTAEDSEGNIGTCDFELTVRDTLGQGDQDLDTQIFLIPNPANFQVTIVNQSNRILDKLQIFDLNGRTLMNMALGSIEGNPPIDVSEFANGVYFVVVESENISVIKKLVKK
ncbi:MAG: HYR domain-containing protein, partial [Flavobacteriaceae bacterium]|nr:HYR domain-containing protein [Flavobacteriaceae bacterium]